ncbi:hypothetical protein [Alteromonas facilis]|uniref:hypothetical protein n=1 Tax=Alteromonas facilis TaxID=2048004 RepID=UPI000C2852D8|nr:hypothetical protein [Alteromonas facilis]
MNNVFPIQSETAKKVWNNFDRELIHKLKSLPLEERTDIRLEILSHLYESLIKGPADKTELRNSQSEEVRLINAISNLGSPDEYLEPLIADILLYQKASKGHPGAILKGLQSSAKKGLVHALATLVLGMGYFWVIMIFIMSLMHIADPDIGIWYYPTGEVSLSFSAQPGATQWLPGWFSLVGIVSSTIAYWALSKVLSYFIARMK